MLIRARKDPKHIWHKLSYLVSEKDIQEIVGIWPAEWHKAMERGAETSKSTKRFVAQKRKDVAQKVAQALVEQKRKEVVAKAATKKESTTKVQAEKEHPDTEKFEELALQHLDE